MKSKKSRTKAYIIPVSVCIAICMMITACGSYKPPYQRGYDEGYSAGYSDGSSGAPEAVSTDVAKAADKGDSTGDSASDVQNTKDGDDGSTDKNEADEAETPEEDTSAADVTEVADDTSGMDDSASVEVLAETDGPTESGAAKSWGGRVIRAEAVNEAMYSNPEVIEGLRQLYDDTVQYYMSEQGLRPSKKMMEQFERLGTRLQHQHAVLDEIQAELSGAHDDSGGGYVCSYPVFLGIYRMIERLLERGGQSVYLMLCTVIDGKGNPMKEGPMLDELTKRMGDAVRQSIRRTDSMSRYGKGQYLVLLVNTTRENCQVIQRRINEHFMEGRRRIGIKYYVNSVFWTP